MRSGLTDGLDALVEWANRKAEEERAGLEEARRLAAEMPVDPRVVRAREIAAEREAEAVRASDARVLLLAESGLSEADVKSLSDAEAVAYAFPNVAPPDTLEANIAVLSDEDRAAIERGEV